MRCRCDAEMEMETSEDSQVNDDGEEGRCVMQLASPCWVFIHVHVGVLSHLVKCKQNSV